MGIWDYFQYFTHNMMQFSIVKYVKNYAFLYYFCI